MAIIRRAQKAVDRLMVRFAVERTAAGWSQRDLAKTVGIHPTSVTRMEDGIHTPTVGFLASLLEPMGLKLDIVSEDKIPLLELNEMELKALIAAAAVEITGVQGAGYNSDCAYRALRKLRVVDPEVEQG